jgi:5-methylcytosine-specific restriction endonuclease McrA
MRSRIKAMCKKGQSHDINEARMLFSSVDAFVSHLARLRANRLEAKKGRAAANGARPSIQGAKRQAVLAVTGGRCHICGGAISGRWVVDHVLARARGGEDSSNNLLPAHETCNRYRWFYGTEEFQWIIKLGVYFRTQIEEERNPVALELASSFLAHERRARRRIAVRLRKPG